MVDVESVAELKLDVPSAFSFPSCPEPPLYCHNQNGAHNFDNDKLVLNTLLSCPEIVASFIRGGSRPRSGPTCHETRDVDL